MYKTFQFFLCTTYCKDNLNKDRLEIALYKLSSLITLKHRYVPVSTYNRYLLMFYYKLIKLTG